MGSLPCAARSAPLCFRRPRSTGVAPNRFESAGDAGFTAHDGVGALRASLSPLARRLLPLQYGLLPLLLSFLALFRERLPSRLSLSRRALLGT